MWTKREKKESGHIVAQSVLRNSLQAPLWDVRAFAAIP